MASNVNSKNKDMNNTSISDSSEDDDIFQNSSDKGNSKSGDLINKSKIEYIGDTNSEMLCINLTDNFETKKKKNQNQVIIKDKNFYQFITAVIQDDKSQLEKILKTTQPNSIINHESLEGLTPIQYAALYGSVSCFHYLLSLKAQTDIESEGLHLIHLSLSRGIFIKHQEKCIKMFNYIYEKLPEQKKYVDRLGRTFLHLIFEYDFMEALNEKNITTEDLFKEDKNGDYVINYVYIYNSGKCFWKVARDPYFLGNLYREIRNRFSQNKNPKFLLKEKFLDNLFIHQNFYIIAIIVVNSSSFVNELMEDLNSLKNYYSQIEPNKSDIEQRNIMQMSQNINYVINIVEKLNSKDFNEQREMHFDFPQKLQEYTAIVFNSNCIKHIQLPDEHVKHLTTRLEMYENSDRLACLIDKENGIILNDQVFHYRGCNLDNEYRSRNSGQGSGCENILFFKSERKSTLNDILKCHDIDYIEKLKNLCEKIRNESNNSHIKHKHDNKNNNSSKHENGINYNLNCINTNPMFQNSIQNNSHNLFNYQKIDCDTFINEYSYENIYNTTGCVFDAIDLVMKGTVRNAFALVRPPGHHAGYYGPVENPVLASMGFCIVNNVAIGAAYAKYKYKNDINKIAIVDFDVHHGNGTEEIIQMLNGKIFTDTIIGEKVGTIINKKNKRLNWLDFDDAKNILFISTHLYNDDNPKLFYPYTGATDTNTSKDSELYPGGILNIPFVFKNTNDPQEYRNVLRTKIIPRLYKFKPDLIFISAGFDGHENELINQGCMQLSEFDFAYITQQIQFVANKFSKGRVVSVLEGGYNVATGLISSFAQSAFIHTRFLNLSINMFHCYDVKLSGLKRKYEIQDEIEVFDKNNKGKGKTRRSERIRQQEDEEYKKDDF